MGITRDWGARRDLTTLWRLGRNEALELSPACFHERYYTDTTAPNGFRAWVGHMAISITGNDNSDSELASKALTPVESNLSWSC